MSIEFREPKRENAPLLIGLAGGTGSGKTYSALRMARGLANGQPFAVIDTENGRALHYTDFFPEMRHGNLRAPFSPAAYANAITAADSAGFPVIVVDSASHIWEGEGGVLEMQQAEAARLGNREATKMLSWAAPKQAHKRFVSKLLQVKAHVILCMRAEDKIEMVKENGSTVVRPKQTLKGAGLDGWIPICEKRLPFELTLSFLLTSEQPGIPRPIKLQEQHKPFFPLDQQVGEETGKQLAAWAAGATVSAEEPSRDSTEASHSSASALATETSSSADSSQAHRKKLDVLVGQLRDAGHITTNQLWAAVGRDPWMEGHGDDPHWSPLRDSLSKKEASDLIERLEKFAKNVAVA